MLKQDHPYFKIEWKERASRSSYFEMDDKYDIEVIDLRTNEVWKSFYRYEYMNSNGSYDKGVEEIGFSEDGNTLLVKMEGKAAIESYLLP
jgi:DNA relaxase NicK